MLSASRAGERAGWQVRIGADNAGFQSLLQSNAEVAAVLPRRGRRENDVFLPWGKYYVESFPLLVYSGSQKGCQRLPFLGGLPLSKPSRLTPEGKRHVPMPFPAHEAPSRTCHAAPQTSPAGGERDFCFWPDYGRMCCGVCTE